MKRMISLLLALILVLSLCAVPAFAAQLPEGEGTVQPASDEVTEWVYRYTETGQRQKRLWSLTNHRWIGDWIDC